MKISSLTLIIFFIVIHPSCQRNVTKELNLDFEQVDYTGKFPAGWIVDRITPDKIELDLNVSYSGTYSLMIENKGNNGFENSVTTANRIIKNIHPKHSITVSAFIKTENVTSDSTGLYLWYTTFSKDTLVTLKDKRLPGTNDWQEFSITIPVKEEPDYWLIGVSQNGEGRIWVDNIKIKIDGEEYSKTLSKSKPGVSEKELLWLKNHYSKLSTINPDENFEDLQPLKSMIGEARIVGLGENTHGSKEVFMMKHRLVRFLATEMGFNVFAIEANMPESYKINDYTFSNDFVLNNYDYPKSLLKGLWNTQEVLDMINWMRQFNMKEGTKIQFTGFDMQHYMGALQNIAGYSKISDPDLRLKIDSISPLFEIMYQNAIKGIGRKNDLAEIKTRCNDIQTYLTENKDRIIQKSDSNNYKWLLQNATVLMQYLQLAGKGISGPLFRDECMATNVKWILENNPDSKIILWAHNGHITKRVPQMGYYLDKEYGKKYYNIGFLSNSGKYTAESPRGLNTNNILEPGKPGSFEYEFHRTGTPYFYFDFSKVTDNEPDGLWLKSKFDHRSIGADARTDQFLPIAINKHFNAIIYIDSTSASKSFDIR